MEAYTVTPKSLRGKGQKIGGSDFIGDLGSTLMAKWS